MRNKLFFIPYQDSDVFYSSAILTREYAILYMLSTLGIEEILNIKKPRTILDRKKIHIDESHFPADTIEREVKEILEKTVKIQYVPFVNFNQVLKRRAWWIEGYRKTIQLLENLNIDFKEYIVYSNNPFACDLIEYLKQKGALVYFDAMDNFTIHPSLKEIEHHAAYEGYKKVVKHADLITANSTQTCEFISNNFNENCLLIKNGVFFNNKAKGFKSLRQYSILNNKKKNYKNSIGYIGKIGKRIDSSLVDHISRECPSSLFVFIGPILEGQKNENLQSLFKSRRNILHLEGIPSAYVLEMLDEFDILSIPHATGKSENGGDPLKLYQYLTREKTIMTTPILGVDEFKDYIFMSDNASEWSKYINTTPHEVKKITSKSFTWENRFTEVIDELKGWA